jgi:hypothetical protein
LLFVCADDAVCGSAGQGGASNMVKTSKASGSARERRAEVERELDEALDESFPASDPISMTRTSAGAPDHRAPKPARSGQRVESKKV